MTKAMHAAAARIAQEVPNTEAQIDEALISLSSLMTTLVQARRDTGVASSTGQASIRRLVKAQSTLLTVSNDVLRVHGDLLEIGRETAGLPMHDDCEKAQAVEPVLKLAS